MADGVSCDDRNGATLNDVCTAGVCSGQAMQCRSNADCSDGNACNGAEICNGGLECLPESVRDLRFYEPSAVGVESRLRERIAELDELRRKARAARDDES